MRVAKYTLYDVMSMFGFCSNPLLLLSNFLILTCILIFAFDFQLVCSAASFKN